MGNAGEANINCCVYIAQVVYNFILVSANYIGQLSYRMPTKISYFFSIT